MASFSISKSTAKFILANIKKGGDVQSFLAPVDFNSAKKKVTIASNVVIFQNNAEEIEVPSHLLDACLKENVAYASTADNSWKPMSFKAKDGLLFKLCDPNHDTLIGPILDIGGTKMHISKGYKTCHDFSKKLAQSAIVKPGNVLDLFLGLGYCSREALALESKLVYSFEKYDQVVELVKMNTKFSVNLQEKRFKLKTRTDLETNALFEHLEKERVLFNSVILDPPKFDVLMRIYSQEFLSNLSSYMKSGCLVSCYVPEANVLKHKNVLENVVKTFTATGKFRYIDQVHQVIHRFEKK